MSEEKTASLAQVESLRVARAKLANAIEIFAPLGSTRDGALNLIGSSLIEFEAAVREDERAWSGTPVAPLQQDTSAPPQADEAEAPTRKRK